MITSLKMCSTFECVIKISGHTFDIAIEGIAPKTYLPFGNIYPKIKEISKIAANESIQFNTHEFEIIDGMKRWKVLRMDHFIRNNSVINIKPINCLKTEIMPTIVTTNEVLVTPQTHELPLIGKQILPPITSIVEVVKQLRDKASKGTGLLKVPELEKEKENIELFHTIVMSINIGWDLKNKSPNWRLVRNKVKPFKHKTCIYNHFYSWAGFYAQNYDIFNGLLEPSYQQIFDLLKVVHTLDLDQIYRSNPNKTKIRQISQREEFKTYFRTHLSHIRQQKLKDKQMVTNPNINTRNRNRENISPSMVAVVLTPKKISEYRKMKENASNSVIKSEENSSNFEKEVSINYKNETIDTRKTEKMFKLQTIESFSDIESKPPKKFKM